MRAKSNGEIQDRRPHEIRSDKIHVNWRRPSGRAMRRPPRFRRRHRPKRGIAEWLVERLAEDMRTPVAEMSDCNCRAGEIRGIDERAIL